MTEEAKKFNNFRRMFKWASKKQKFFLILWLMFKPSKYKKIKINLSKGMSFNSAYKNC